MPLDRSHPTLQPQMQRQQKVFQHFVADQGQRAARHRRLSTHLDISHKMFEFKACSPSRVLKSGQVSDVPEQMVFRHHPKEALVLSQSSFQQGIVAEKKIFCKAQCSIRGSLVQEHISLAEDAMQLNQCHASSVADLMSSRHVAHPAKNHWKSK